MFTTFYIFDNINRGVFSLVVSTDDVFRMVALLEAQSKIVNLYYKLDKASYDYLFLKVNGNMIGEFPSLRTEFTENEWETVGKPNMDYIKKLSKMEYK